MDKSDHNFFRTPADGRASHAVERSFLVLRTTAHGPRSPRHPERSVSYCGSELSRRPEVIEDRSEDAPCSSSC